MPGVDTYQGGEAIVKTALDAWGKILFFLQTRSSLGNNRPLDLLRERRVEDARLAAEAYVE